MEELALSLPRSESFGHAIDEVFVPRTIQSTFARRIYLDQMTEEIK